MGNQLGNKIFHVQGMSCPSCEIKIENILHKIEGVKEVKASLAKSEVSVKYDPSLVRRKNWKRRLRK